MSTNDALKTRYTDAYAVSNAVTRIGALLKFCGAAVMIVALFMAINVGGTTSQSMFGPPQSNAGVGVVIFVFGAVAGICLVAFGALISAHGQTLRATLDSAVNGSPFLTNSERAEVMGLPAPSGAATLV